MNNAPLRIPAPVGSREELFEFIEEIAALARIQAGLAETNAQIGDPIGMGYAARRLAGYTKAILTTLADIQAMGAGDAQ